MLVILRKKHQSILNQFTNYYEVHSLVLLIIGLFVN